MAPTLRPDGSLLAREGYDEETRLLLVGLPKMHSVPDVPTRDDAEQALAELGDLLREMQFVGAADKAVALSLIVSAVVRGALAHIPLHLIKAPSIGSGTSFLVDLANVVETGQRCEAVAARSEKGRWNQMGKAAGGGR